MKYMSYKSVVWPENPEKLCVEHRRDPFYGEDSDGLPVYLGMGQPRCVVKGSGVFTGALAYESFETLQEVFTEPHGGVLTLPHGQTVQAYFSELTMEQDSRPQLVKYHFTFLGTDETGAVPV